MPIDRQKSDIISRLEVLASSRAAHTALLTGACLTTSEMRGELSLIRSTCDIRRIIARVL